MSSAMDRNAAALMRDAQQILNGETAAAEPRVEAFLFQSQFNQSWTWPPFPINEPSWMHVASRILLPDDCFHQVAATAWGNLPGKRSLTRAAFEKLGRAVRTSERLRQGLVTQANEFKDLALGVYWMLMQCKGAADWERAAWGADLGTWSLRKAEHSEVDETVVLLSPGPCWYVRTRDLLSTGQMVLENFAGGHESMLIGRSAPPGSAFVSAITTDSRDEAQASRRSVLKPDGWTKCELVGQASDRADGLGGSTFDRIRKAAGVKPAEPGGRGQQRRFSHEELRRLIAAVEAGRFQRRAEIGAAWRQLFENEVASQSPSSPDW